MEALVQRLEAVTIRLEATEVQRVQQVVLVWITNSNSTEPHGGRCPIPATARGTVERGSHGTRCLPIQRATHG